ncbi:protein DJ-1 homolog B-like [Citrus sinensis]|uniref:protein DJ-1 homolog B-like n=1 Tax=Citrus sinensis TaxID=2711 RepID=UPI0022797AAF|nr:protein DJ-1 homolog B-like [Citrus sinensis]
MLDTRFKQYQDAVIGTVLTTLHAGSVLLTFYPNFNLSLQDPNLPTTLKVQVQIQGAEQISSAKIATLHHQLVYRLQNHALDLPAPEHHSDTLMVQIPSLKNLIFSFTTTATMSSTSKRVLVPVANGSEPIEAVITIDVLRRSGADVTVASVEKQLSVDACHGVKIVADALVSDCGDAVFDLIALPGGMPGATNLKESEVLETIVKKQASAGRLYAAVCASPAVALGSWGLLKGLKATCYPSFMEQLAPACAATVESRVQQDGKVVTSRGPGTAMIGGLGGAQAFAKSEKLVHMLKKQKESNRPYGARCASPALVLEPHGLLKGKKATAFPAMCNKLSDQSEIENRVVVDGNLITSRGPGTSMEFALAIVEKFFGRNKALELAKIMLFTRA